MASVGHGLPRRRERALSGARAPAAERRAVQLAHMELPQRRVRAASCLRESSSPARVREAAHGRGMGESSPNRPRRRRRFGSGGTPRARAPLACISHVERIRVATGAATFIAHDLSFAFEDTFKLLIELLKRYGSHVSIIFDDFNEIESTDLKASIIRSITEWPHLAILIVDSAKDRQQTVELTQDKGYRNSGL